MKTSGIPRGLAIVAGAALLTTMGGTAFAQAVPSSSPITPAAAPPGRYSFDLTVVGVPTRTVSGEKQAGALDVYFPDGRTQRLSQSNLGFGSSSYQLFGAASAVRDLNGDGLSDIVVGAPGVASKGRTGHAYVLFQTERGFTAAKSAELDNNAVAGDRFGAAVTFGLRRSSDTMLDLWVGSPGRDAGGAKDSGAVYRYYVNIAAGTLSYNDVISQNTAEISQTSEPGDQFGEVLAEKENGVVIGVPHEDVGAGRDAGAVTFVNTNIGTDLLNGAYTYTQNTKGIPGAAATGDRFGASVALYGIAVGAPGDDLGPLKDAGRIQLFAPGSTTGPPTAFGSFTQDSDDILGAAKSGQQYGSSLAFGIFRCRNSYQLAIGAPGVDVGKAKDAGGVYIQNLPLFGSNGCKSKLVTQGKGKPLGGTARSGDHLGKVISTLTGDTADANERIDNLAIGVPGKDAKKAKNTGVSVVWNDKGKGVLKTFGYSGGKAKGQAYGSSFGYLPVLPELLS